jgi:alpha-glucosidase
MRSYWGAKQRDLPDAFYKMIAALMIALPGAFCLWQGDELGLPEARIPDDIPESAIKDPFGKLLYPDVKGRDGSRTPMPWRHDTHLAGFTSADEAWLPIPDAHLARAVDLQSADPASLLNHWRQLLHWRSGQPALCAGRARLAPFTGELLGLLRESETQSLLCLFNFGEQATEANLSSFEGVRLLAGIGAQADLDTARKRARLPPWGVLFAQIEHVPRSTQTAPT